MDLGRAGLAQHADDRPLRGAAHDGVVHHDEALARDVLGEGVQLAPDRVGPLLLARCDEGAPDVAVLDQSLPVGDAAGAGEALRRRDARLGHPHHHVGLGRRLLRQQLARAAPDVMDLPAVEPAVRPRDVGELEDAQTRLHVA